MTGESSSSRPPPPQALSNLLAPGFRFYPTEEELLCYYLKRKVSGLPILVDAIAEVDLYKAEPWDLPAKSHFRSGDMEWYFFTPLHHKSSTGSRINRTTSKGYWKTTGKDRRVRHGSRVVGMKKTLVFHLGRAPGGERTDWVMHEYRLEDDELVRPGILQDLESSNQLEDLVPIEASSYIQTDGGYSKNPSTKREAPMEESFLDGLLLEDFLGDWAICADGSAELQN